MPSLDLWQLPREVSLAGSRYALHTDYRDILQILSVLQDKALPPLFRWQIALALFYTPMPPPDHRPEAMAYLADFIRCGAEDTDAPALIYWQQDAGAIISDINQVSGREIRAEAYIHWWTFLSWFHSIGQGQLSYLVGLRSKLRRGEKLDPAEQAFFQSHRNQVLPALSLTAAEQEQKDRLQQRLTASKASKEGK